MEGKKKKSIHYDCEYYYCMECPSLVPIQKNIVHRVVSQGRLHQPFLLGHLLFLLLAAHNGFVLSLSLSHRTHYLKS